MCLQWPLVFGYHFPVQYANNHVNHFHLGRNDLTTDEVFVRCSPQMGVCLKQTQMMLKEPLTSWTCFQSNGLLLIDYSNYSYTSHINESCLLFAISTTRGGNNYWIYYIIGPLWLLKWDEIINKTHWTPRVSASATASQQITYTCCQQQHLQLQQREKASSGPALIYSYQTRTACKSRHMRMGSLQRF